MKLEYLALMSHSASRPLFKTVEVIFPDFDDLIVYSGLYKDVKEQSLNCLNNYIQQNYVKKKMLIPSPRYKIKDLIDASDSIPLPEFCKRSFFKRRVCEFSDFLLNPFNDVLGAYFLVPYNEDEK